MVLLFQKYWAHSKLEQFQNENSYIFEILSKIVIDFNKFDKISFNSDGNLSDINKYTY